MFLQGKYSQFSEKLKTKILSQFPTRDDAAASNVLQILTPSKAAKSRIAERLNCPVELIEEVASIPDIEQETLIVTN